MDRQVGRLPDCLRSAGIFDDALILVTADHGELLGEGGFFSHSWHLDPELVAVPPIVKWPGQVSFSPRCRSCARSALDLAAGGGKRIRLMQRLG